MADPFIRMSFRGICTHLLATHQYTDRPKFEIEGKNGDLKIQHRVVLANSNLIPTHIDPARGVLPHVPKLRIRGEVPKELASIMQPSGEWSEYLLNDVAVSFAGEDHALGDESHHDSLSHLPRLWPDPAEPVLLRRRVLSGWTKHASAYIDFTGGLKFSTRSALDPNDPLLAELYFMPGLRQIVFRPRNQGDGIAYDLGDVTEIEFSNLPAALPYCADSDYLLHYFATNIDLCEDAPVWTPPPPPPDGEPPIAEVFCSSSTYP